MIQEREQALRQAQGERHVVHWATQYIGQRWESGANGPDAWDCGTFVRHIQRTHYGREIPHAFADASNIHAVVRALAGLDLGDWDEMPAPQDGDGAILAHARYGSHVGVWIDVDGGGVLHCQNGAGVIFTPAAKLAPSGWGRVRFYRPATRPLSGLPLSPSPSPPRVEGGES